ncbi:MAG: choice-of-anchor tandem repeat GloVer-containing protein [Rhodanobacteraceae bacterium]
MIRRKAMSRIHESWVLWAGGAVLSLLVPISSAQVPDNERILRAPPAGDGPYHEQVLHTFAGDDGQYPTGRLVTDKFGNLYGTTYTDVFELTAEGVLEVLHTFVQDLGAPNGLMIDDSGILYGTTTAGGACHHGVVFRLAPDGSYTILHYFADGNDGASPTSELIMDPAGNLYGTTNRGGAYNAGTVFEVEANGAETVLYTFTGGDDGLNPVAGLVMDEYGNLYGATQGGAQDAGNVFKLTPRGQETVLHDFDGADGRLPWGTLIRDDDGNLYGTTLEGGAGNRGTVFLLTPAGQETVLHSFAGGSDGAGRQRHRDRRCRPQSQSDIPRHRSHSSYLKSQSGFELRIFSTGLSRDVSS